MLVLGFPVGHHAGAQTPVRTHHDRFQKRMSLVPEFANVETQQDAVHGGDAEDRNEADRRRHAERRTGKDQAEDAAEARDRNLREDYERVDAHLI